MTRSKFGNRKTAIDGITFHSAREAGRYVTLKMMERIGEIELLELQPKFAIIINGMKCFTYVADFGYVEKGSPVVEDCKGFRTPIYRLKKKCVEAQYRIKIRET